MTARRRNPKPTPVPAEFRAAAHALLDEVLDENPGVGALLIAWDGPKGVNAASIPGVFSVKLGMTDQLYARLHPETAEATGE